MQNNFITSGNVNNMTTSSDVRICASYHIFFSGVDGDNVQDGDAGNTSSAPAESLPMTGR